MGRFVFQIRFRCCISKQKFQIMKSLYLGFIILLIIMAGYKLLVVLSKARERKQKQDSTQPRYRPAIIKRHP